MSDDPEVEVRFQVRELTPQGIDARATCRACDEPMLRYWEARPQILWFRCPGCAGVTSLALLILLRCGEAAQEDPGFVQELYLSANPRVPPGRFRLPG